MRTHRIPRYLGDRASSTCTREEKKYDPVEESGEVYEVGLVDRETRDTIYRLTGAPYRIRLGKRYRVGAWLGGDRRREERDWERRRKEKKGKSNRLVAVRN